MSNKQAYLAIISCLFLFGLFSCMPPSKINRMIEKDLTPEGYVKATVRHEKGKEAPCDYLLQLDESTWIEPDRIPEEFRRNGLEVWIKHLPSRRPSLCSKGFPSTISDIQKRGR